MHFGYHTSFICSWFYIRFCNSKSFVGRCEQHDCILAHTHTHTNEFWLIAWNPLWILWICRQSEAHEFHACWTNHFHLNRLSQTEKYQMTDTTSETKWYGKFMRHSCVLYKTAKIPMLFYIFSIEFKGTFVQCSIDDDKRNLHPKIFKVIFTVNEVKWLTE